MSENRIRHADIHGTMTVNQLVRQMEGCAFGAGRIGAACDILEEMQAEDVTKFLGLSGAMVPAGMRKIISDMIRDGYIDVLVTTGANMVHDVIEGIGCCHEKGSATADDMELKKQHINRIYDVYLNEDYFGDLEDKMQQIYGSLDPAKTYSIRELMSEIGKNIEDKDSILRAAYDCNVPVYCPAIQDSVLGLQAWLFKQANKLNVDVFADMRNFMDTCYEAKRTGAVLLGGGVPKNYILQSMLVTPRGGFDYVIQITMDRAETGGLSGATLDEARSWGKVGDNAKAVQVICDTTIALPLMLAAVSERKGRK
ncbi:deoxyhypusine synthase [Methanocella arvoryzae]|uniref:Deoxyhypusine synthase n=1 Tax=Methanocella arvoryzae (strain DSM 22066 / NBRC 105507 / MRE50) TaxID=351160 RepID=Q0W123_METAR|nr:deoxyhypusine synthase [Methanocella arvoryzae]CAJ37920.1 putative deoxyhypusine synthase [Methanocella arvoryzae MRE50]